MEEAPELPPAQSHFPGSGRGEALTTDTDLSAGVLLGEVTLPMPQDPDTTVRLERTLLEAGAADGPVLVEVAGDLQVGEHDREVSVILTRGEVAWQSPEGRQRSRTALLHFRDLSAGGSVGPRRNVEVAGPERDSLRLEDPTAADHGLVVEWIWSDVSDLGPAPEEADGVCDPGEPTHECCLLIISFICITRETRDLEVSDVAATGELRVRVYRGVERGAELSVRCEPGEPVRGEEVTCRAKTDPEDAELSVKRWSFEGGGHTVEAERTQPTWQGRMVVSGTVTVAATVAGEDTTASTNIKVEPRSWKGKRVPFSVQEITPNDLPEKPSREGELGNIKYPRIPRPAEEILSTVQAGPNEGLSFLTGIPIGIAAEVRVNRAALSKKSAFWKLQPTRTRVPSRCTRSDVVTVIPKILRHEGIPPTPRSHAGIFQAAVDTLLGPAVEPVVEEPVFRLITAAQQAARKAVTRAEAADDRADRKFPVQHCRFRFFPSTGGRP